MFKILKRHLMISKFDSFPKIRSLRRNKIKYNHLSAAWMTNMPKVKIHNL
jgi:hypothetical protein